MGLLLLFPMNLSGVIGLIWVIEITGTTWITEVVGITGITKLDELSFL